jgi:hypothetical protein
MNIDEFAIGYQRVEKLLHDCMEINKIPRQLFYSVCLTKGIQDLVLDGIPKEAIINLLEMSFDRLQAECKKAKE